jgi:hypothetical protein
MPEQIYETLVMEYDMQGLPAPDNVPFFQHLTQENIQELCRANDDNDPVYVIRPVAQIGRVSNNGMLYDEELVQEIERQLPQMGGVRGHVPPEQRQYAFPRDAVHWVGAMRRGDTLYAKGYIPPGEDRRDIQSKHALKRRIGTSIYGQGVREEVREGGTPGVWRLRSPKLESLDLAPAARASLEMGNEMKLVREMTDEEPEETQVMEITAQTRQAVIAEMVAGEQPMPPAVRQKVIAELSADDLPESLAAEMRRYASVVGEIRTTIDSDSDMSDEQVVAMVAEMQRTLQTVADSLGTDRANVAVRVEEMRAHMETMRVAQFNQIVDDVVAEMTPYQVGDEHAQHLSNIRAMLRGQITATLGSTDATPEQVKDAATAAVDNGFNTVLEMFVKTVGGPAAPDVDTRRPGERGERQHDLTRFADPDKAAELKERFKD